MSPQWRRPRQTGGGWARAGKASLAPAEAGAEAPLVTGEHSMRGMSGAAAGGWGEEGKKRTWLRTAGPRVERVGLERREEEQARPGPLVQ